MAVTNYYTIAGEVIAERTAGSARVDYLTDALGSITATVNQSAQVVNTYRYKPAGSQLAKTGTGADPAFGWAGYLPTQKRFSEHYLRGRHVSDLIGVFTTKDKFVAGVSPFAYALNNPVLFTDPMGWAPCSSAQTCCCCPVKLSATHGQWSQFTRPGISGTWDGCEIDVTAVLQWKPYDKQLPCHIDWTVTQIGNSPNVGKFQPVSFPKSDAGKAWAVGSKPNCTGKPPFAKETIVMPDYPGIDASLVTAWRKLKIVVSVWGDDECCGKNNTKKVTIVQYINMVNNVMRTPPSNVEIY